MMKKVFFRFCQVLNKENFEIYQLLSKKIEEQPFKISIVDMWKLSSKNLVDIKIWQKTEEQFSKWLNHIDTDDLTRFSLLIQKHSQFLSQKTKIQFENRIRKLQKKLNSQQIPIILEKVFPITTEQVKQLLIQLAFNTQNISPLNQMKCLLIILENSKTMPYQVIEKAKNIAQFQDFNNYDEIIVYLQLFYSDIIKNWVDIVSNREETKLKLNEIIYGYHTNKAQLKINESLNYMNLQEIKIQIDRLKKDEQQEFKRFLTLIQFMRACKYSNIKMNENSEIQSLFQQNFHKLTPFEILQIISEIDQVVEKKIQITSLKQYINQNLQNLNQNYLIMFQTANLKYLQSVELSEIFILNLQITLEKLELTVLPQLQNILLKTRDSFPSLQDQIEKKIQMLKEITIKSINIQNVIKLNCALQLTRNIKLDNLTLQNLWKKVKIDNLEQIQQVLIILRNDANQQKLNIEQMTLIQAELRNQFQIVTN